MPIILNVVFCLPNMENFILNMLAISHSLFLAVLGKVSYEIRCWNNALNKI